MGKGNRVRVNGVEITKKVYKKRKKLINKSIDASSIREGQAINRALKVKRPLTKKMTRSRAIEARGGGKLDLRAARKHIIEVAATAAVTGTLWAKCKNCKCEFDGLIQELSPKKYNYDKYGDRVITCHLCGTTYWHYNEGNLLRMCREVKGWKSTAGDLILMSKISNWSK